MLFIFNAFKIFWKLQIESPGFLSRPTIDVNDLFCFSVIRRMRERIQDTDFHFEVKVLTSFRPQLDHFRKVAFPCGSPETPPELLNSCENRCANARRKLEEVSTAFNIVLLGSR
jgi:hypothetical protein